MRSPADHLDHEPIARREDHPLRTADPTHVQRRIHVEGKGRLHRVAIQGTLAEHQLGTALLAVRRTLLGRLEEEHHHPRQPPAQAREHLRDARSAIAV